MNILYVQFTRFNVLYLFALAVVFASLLFFGADANAKEQEVILTFAVNDELGYALDRTPQVALDNCDIERMGLVAPVEGEPSKFIVTLYKDTTMGTDFNCDVEVSARGYLTAPLRELGDIKFESSVDISSNPFALAFGLKVQVYDDSGSTVEDAEIYHSRQSPVRRSGSTAWFATQGTHSLEVFHIALSSETNATQKGLGGVTAGFDGKQTSLTLKGNTACSSDVSALSKMQCASLKSPFTVYVQDSLGKPLVGAEIEVYSDIERKKIAFEYGKSQVTEARQSTIGGSNSFVLLPRIYYLKVDKFQYEDYHETVVIDGDSPKSVTVKLYGETSKRLNPQRSVITVLGKGSAVADGNQVIVINVEPRSSDESNFQSMGVEIISSRKSDTISYPNGKLSNEKGVVVAYVTSVKDGTSVLTTKADGKIISSFPSITFTADPDNLVVDASTSSMTTTASPILADGSEDVTVTVTVKNASGSLLKDKAVSLSSDRAEGDTITAIQNTTLTDGTARFKFTSTKPGTAMLYASADGTSIYPAVAVSVSPLPK